MFLPKLLLSVTTLTFRTTTTCVRFDKTLSPVSIPSPTCASRCRSLIRCSLIENELYCERGSALTDLVLHSDQPCSRCSVSLSTMFPRNQLTRPELATAVGFQPQEIRVSNRLYQEYAHPGAMLAHPEALFAHPGAMLAHHGALLAHPGAVHATRLVHRRSHDSSDVPC